MAFVLVYIKEAHPNDGWQMPANRKEGVVFNAPKTLAERTALATTCTAKLELSIPCVVDGMDNRVEQAYTGWPERLYIVGDDGKLVYKGAPGPAGFNPAEMEQQLKTTLKAEEARK